MHQEMTHQYILPWGLGMSKAVQQNINKQYVRVVAQLIYVWEVADDR
jgi:hypothetical protein